MVNMLVLTHKDMSMNPINIILTGIAVADCLVMMEYIPFNIHISRIFQADVLYLYCEICNISWT